MIEKAQLEHNLYLLHQNVASACAEVGRLPAEVQIVAASKQQSAQTVDLLDGLRDVSVVGENRVQEFCEKYHQCSHLTWDFIGQLQSNKAKQLVGCVRLIHSVDRASLVEAISRQCTLQGISQDVLVEVNLTSDSARGGVPVTEIDDFISLCSSSFGVKVRGLMAVMPVGEDPTQGFRLMQRLFEQRRSDSFSYLSMGMSADYIQAIRYGANIIRVGTAIFGQRLKYMEGI